MNLIPIYNLPNFIQIVNFPVFVVNVECVLPDIKSKYRAELAVQFLNYTVTDFRKAKEIDIKLAFSEPLYVSFEG